MSPENQERMIANGRQHLEFCMKLYRIQVEQGLYFLHEHPAHARSWQEPFVRDLVQDYRVHTVKGDMCCFAMN